MENQPNNQQIFIEDNHRPRCHQLQQTFICVGNITHTRGEKAVRHGLGHRGSNISSRGN